MNRYEVEKHLKCNGWEYIIDSSDIVDFRLGNGKRVVLTLQPAVANCRIQCPSSLLSIIRQKYTSIKLVSEDTILWNNEELESFFDLCVQSEDGGDINVRQSRIDIDNLRQRLLNIEEPQRDSEQNKRNGQDLLRGTH